MIKLLALDLDGTVLNSQGKIPDANRGAIRAAEDAGVLVTIATGRRFRDAQPVAIDLGLNAPLISHNGALLKYAETLETVAASLLELETTREIVRAGKKYGGDALVSSDPHGKGSMIYDRISDDNRPLQKYLAWSKGLHGDEANEAIIHVADLHDELPRHEVIHISFSGGCGSMAKLLDFLRSELGETVTILPTIYPQLDFTLIDILPPKASKGTGVEKLASLHGLTAADVMVIGDNYNDLEMLEFAGTPVVMGNADKGLLDNSKYHRTLTNNQNGVAAAIDKFILHPQC